MSKRSPLLHLCAVIAAYLALALLVPKATFMPNILKAIHAAMPHSGKLLGAILGVSGFALFALPTVAFMAIQVAIVYYYGRIKMSGAQVLLALVVFLACAVGLTVLLVHQSGIPAKMRHFPNLRESLFILANYPHFLRLPIVLLVMLTAASIGYLVSLRIKDKNLLLPVMMFAAAIDWWTVTRGPVSHVVQNAPAVVAAVSAPIPQAGAGAFVPVTLVGPGDFLFMTLVFAAVHRLGMNDRRTYWFVTATMTLGMLVVAFGLLPYLPALTVLAVGAVAANWRHFKLTKQEAISIAIVGVVLAVSVPFVWWMLRPAAGGKPAQKPRAPVTAPETEGDGAKSFPH